MATEVTVIRELPRDTGQACLVQRGQGFYVVSTTVAGDTSETLVFHAGEDGEITNHREMAGGRGVSRDEAIRALSDGAGMASPQDAGCYVDGHWGQYAVAHMVARATEFGWHDEQLEDLADRHLAGMGPSDAPGITDDEHEVLSDGADEVGAWLNEHAAPEGYSFGWWEGEFFLWPNTQWEDESY